MKQPLPKVLTRVRKVPQKLFTRFSLVEKLGSVVRCRWELRSLGGCCCHGDAAFLPHCFAPEGGGKRVLVCPRTSTCVLSVSPCLCTGECTRLTGQRLTVRIFVEFARSPRADVASLRLLLLSPQSSHCQASSVRGSFLSAPNSTVLFSSRASTIVLFGSEML